MDFDDAKENIQPLAQGRNASILHASLRVESTQELYAQRKVLEKEIHNYKGDDPLSVWYDYIEWIEQSFPSGGKESGLQEVLSKCLAQFESDERYKQDRRMIKLYIKFIDTHKDPAECYQQLFNAGIGTMIADFYIAWAYCYDLVGNTRKADEIFLRGIACRAQPLEELQEARQHFGFSVAQRLMYKDDDPIREETNRQLHERRMALTSLRAHRRKLVGSIRTGSAIKNMSPGKVKIDLPSTSSQRDNVRVQVFKDENENPNFISLPESDSTSTNEVGKSVVRAIIDAARNQENQKEPGPWNKALNRKKGHLFRSSKTTNELGFEIHEDVHDDSCEDINNACVPPIPITDTELKVDKPFIYPPNFCSISKPIKGWMTPVTTEEIPDVNTLPEYNKCKLYPRPNMEFQPEELKAYNILKKRGIENDFTKERDLFWACGPLYNIRLYPHFATKSKKQITDSMDEYFIPENIPGLKVAFDDIYNKEGEIERQFEEILAFRLKRNETNIETADMEETMCTTSEKVQRRKSFFPLRKSLAPSTFKSLNRISMKSERNETVEKQSINEPTSCTSICSTGAKAADDNSEIKCLTFQKDNETETQAVAVETFIPTVSKTALKEETSQMLLDRQQQDTEMQAKLTTINAASNASLPIPFEIFKDDSSKEVTCVKNVQDDNDFKFKTPALPTPNSTPGIAVPSKIPFEIFDDENLLQQSPSSKTKPDLGSGTGGFFDADETCSTQTFNIYLKAQSVSTPKPVVKSKPQKYFGNVLKEVAPPDQKEDKIENQNPTNDDQNYIAESQNVLPVLPSTIVFSPLRQQLSTILETSEHGTTQGTHTTGATTKSTFGSPEFDIDSQVQTTANVGINQLSPVIETVKELSSETSVEKMMKSLNIQNLETSPSKTLSAERSVETPAALRMRNKSATDGLESSIFEFSIKNDKKLVGNFSRLEEKEDTAAGFVFKTLPSIRFQDDKTETIPKILITSQQLKFQDEKTEPISKIICEPPTSIKFQEDETETISKIIASPPQPVKFPEDKTETISKLIFRQTETAKLEDGKTECGIVENDINHENNMNQDDSYVFFGQTPPKTRNQLIAKQVERGPLSQIRTAADCRTPFRFDSKRFCGKDLAETRVLSKDELHTEFKNKNCIGIQKDMKDSFLTDFLLVEENQRTLPQNKVNPQSKSVFRDSFIPDFSIIDSQIQPEQVQSKNQHQVTANEFNFPEFSLIKNTQSESSKPKQNNSRNLSIFSNFSYVPETQSNESIIKSSQPTDTRHLKQSFIQQLASNKYMKTDLPGTQTEENVSWKQTPKPNIESQTVQKDTHLKNILMDTFMKDFSEINEPPKDMMEGALVQPLKDNSLRFLNESLKKKSDNSKNTLKTACSIGNVSSSKETKLKFLTTEFTEEKICPKEKRLTGDDKEKFFELNCETEMFGPNISMIKNSTWLPNHGPTVSSNAYQMSQIHEKSLHIKCEEVSSISSTSAKNQEKLRPEEDPSVKSKSRCNNDFSIELSTSELAAINAQSFRRHTESTIVIPESPEQNNEDNEMSIYYKQTPKTPKPSLHIWDDSDALKTNAQNLYVHAEPDHNQTQNILENMTIDAKVNPFNVDLINAFLEHHYVISYLESLPTCKLVGCTQRLRQNTKIDINGVSFSVSKLIGEGAYGAIFCGKENSTGKLVAMKQEKPPNIWEYYICLEIQERIRADEMLQSYMSVDYALIGNNCSILISKFSEYGSLITVCNKIKKQSMKNVDEYVVMLLASELLEILDHLHAVNIIHADVKADNFLLMNKLTYPPTKRHLQLIDFGVSIDMKLFKEEQTFSYVHNENSFKCPEMREGRPWTYQLDLYGLAGVIHVLLFGKYMEIEKKARGFWMHKTHVPRYINKNLWDEIFKTLLNIRDCKSMPNLQDLRALLKKEMVEKEKYVLKMVNEFNKALSM